MTITKLFGFLILSGIMVFSNGATHAQNRKTTTTKKTTLSNKKTTTAQQGTPISLDGKKYVGIVKLPGQPIDGWVEMNLNSDNSTIFLAQDNLPISYTATKNGSNINLNLNFNGKFPSTIKSTDGGSSFSGPLKLPTQMNLWLVEVPAKQTPVNMSDAELEEIICSPDGYTGFVKVTKGSLIASCTTEFSIDKTNKTWKLDFDSPQIQNLFSLKEGTYKVENNKLILNNGKTDLVFAVYDDGTYLETSEITGGDKSLGITLIR